MDPDFTRMLQEAAVSMTRRALTSRIFKPAYVSVLRPSSSTKLFPSNGNRSHSNAQQNGPLGEKGSSTTSPISMRT
jgi:hypothetical protein